MPFSSADQYRSKSHRSVFAMGRKAAIAGKPRGDCPYDARSLGGSNGNIPTGARGYAYAWLAGFDSVKGRSNT